MYRIPGAAATAKLPTMSRAPLPIDPILPEVATALAATGAVVLRAPPGAGKTTRVPPALVESGLAGSGQVVLLEPRRVAARAAARRMAAEHGSPVGDVFGYQVRFDRRAGPRTRVLSVTPGVLLRRLHDDPFLEGVTAVICDEFHERGLEADLVLGLCRLLRETVRPDLKLVVMSATVEAGPVATYLGNCPVVDSPGRTFPVKIQYRPRRRDLPLSRAVADAIRDLLAVGPGDVLAFLPGLREIRQTAEELAGLDAEVLPLHGELPPEQQDRALQRWPRRKVVLATNVAETSVTVEGVTAVVDSGLARQREYDPAVGMDRLKLVPISRASADQRAGRAGRTAPGVCVRLWDEASHRGRPEQPLPEIRRVDLAAALLQLLALGEDPARFPWLDPPRPGAVAEGLRLLERLGLATAAGLTDAGRRAAALPVHPRLARLLLEGERLGYPRRAALAAALLAERDPFPRDLEPAPPARTPVPTVSDVLDRVEALEAFEATGRADGPLGRLHPGGARAVLEVRDHLLRLLDSPSDPRAGGQERTTERAETDAALLRCVFAAYPDRLARRRDPGSPRAVLVGGRGVRLAPSSGVCESELFVCVDVDAGGGADALVWLASAVERDWLPPEQVVTRHEVGFDERTERLTARKVTRFEDLVLDEVPGHITDEEEAARILAEAASQRLERCLPPPDSEAGRFRTRVRCLRTWLPELDLPALDPDDLRAALPELCRGRRSLAEIRDAPWLDLFRGRLTWEQLRAVEEEAPDRLTVPSGSRIRLEYQEGRPPVLAVRIQELFGLADTPRVARGRVKVVLHLLAPNFRPQQVTDDLAGFWKTGYPLVRKELRARYPKHSWPDDPLAAEAVRGVRRPRPAE